MCAGGDCTVIMETVCQHVTPFFVAQPNSRQQAFLLGELHLEGLLLMPRAWSKVVTQVPRKVGA